MKTNFSKLLCLMMAMVMVFALCACDSKEGSSSDAALDADSLAVLEYVESNKHEIQEVMGGEYEDLLELDVKAEGTSVVYICNLKVELPEGSEANAQGLVEQLEEPMQETLAQMQEECPAVSSVVVKYYKNDGKLLVQGEFN